MKNSRVLATLVSCLLLLSLVAALAITSGCAHARAKSDTRKSVREYGETLPPGWTVVIPQGTNSDAANAWSPAVFTNSAASTNASGFWANLTAPRPHRFLAFEESWDDSSSGGGTFLLTDPSASQLYFAHTNQTGLGGGRISQIGSIQSMVSSNDVAAITATGNAVGAAIGQALKTASGVPSVPAVSVPASNSPAATLTH